MPQLASGGQLELPHQGEQGRRSPPHGRFMRSRSATSLTAAITGRREEATMDNDDVRWRWIGGEAALGGLMVLLGLVVLLGQVLDLKVGRVAWPVFVIVPGLGLLGLGLTAAGRVGEVLAMVGGVISVNGLVLLVQNATGRFDTWAYAWTLVLVVGPGIGRWLVG